MFKFGWTLFFFALTAFFSYAYSTSGQFVAAVLAFVFLCVGVASIGFDRMERRYEQRMRRQAETASVYRRFHR